MQIWKKIVLWLDPPHLPPQRNPLRIVAWDFWGFMQLMMHTENTAERKCQKENLIELRRSACASLTQRVFLSVQVLSEPLHGVRGSHLAWLQSREIPPQGAPAQSRCRLHLYLASGRSWMSIFLLLAFSAELPSLNQNTAWVQRLKDKKATHFWQVFCLGSKSR